MRILEADPPRLFAFTYFGSRALFELAPDGAGGTDLVLTNSAVPDEDYEEMLPGWLNVLLPLKAAPISASTSGPTIPPAPGANAMSTNELTSPRDQ